VSPGSTNVPTSITERINTSFVMTHGYRSTPHFDVHPKTSPVMSAATLSGIPNVNANISKSCQLVSAKPASVELTLLIATARKPAESPSRPTEKMI
jgi:hypothetical protein